MVNESFFEVKLVCETLVGYHLATIEVTAVSDVALHNAMKRREELREELSKVEAFIAEYERYAALSERLPIGDTLTVTVHRAPSETPQVRSVQTKKRGVPALIGDEVYRILLETRRPMVRSELAKLLQERGFSLPTNDGPRYVGTVLWRQADRFIHREGEGYWIKGMEPSGVFG